MKQKNRTGLSLRKQAAKTMLLFLTALTLLVSCQKQTTSDLKEPSFSEKFFTIAKPLDHQKQLIFQQFKNKEEKTHFTDQFPKNIGFPIWDKAQFNVSTSFFRGAGDDPAPIIVLPLTIDNSNLSGILVAFQGRDGIITAVRPITEEQLYEICHNRNEDPSRARLLLALFLHIDKETFGATVFKNIPAHLFPETGFSDSTHPKNAILQSSALTTSPTTRNANIYMCITLINCTYSGHPSCTPVCDNCNECTTLFCSSYDLGSGAEEDGSGMGPIGGGPTSGGGGGGGSGGGAIQPCGGAWYRPMPCAGDGGGGGGPYYSPQVTYLTSTLNLNGAQTSWLSQHSAEANTIYDELQESINQDPEEDGLILTVPPQDAVIASKITIDALMNGLDVNFNSGMYHEICRRYLPSLSPTIDPGLRAQLSVRCAFLKMEHPNWSLAKVLWVATRDIVHIVLDVVGLVPVIGEVADLTNGIIYTVEGDGINATLSYVSAIPVAGWYAAGIKFAKKSTDLRMIVKAGGLIDFGPRSNLRVALKLLRGDPRQAHHLIPWAFINHKLVQKAAKGNNAFHMNEALNGIPLTRVQHLGSHDLYNQRVLNKLDIINTTKPNLTPNQARQELVDLINTIRTAILNNSTTPVNDIIF